MLCISPSDTQHVGAIKRGNDPKSSGKKNIPNFFSEFAPNVPNLPCVLSSETTPDTIDA